VSFLEPTGLVAPDLILHRIGAELGGCRHLLANEENALETLLQSGNVAADDPLHLVEMQNIDLLDQLLADVILCLQDMAGSEPIKMAAALRVGQVTRRIRLAALRNRLAGFAQTVDPGAGIELF
jgi:hypothetical protein